MSPFALTPCLILWLASTLLVASACTDESGASLAAAGTACNGRDELCERRFDEISFPATHNAHAATASGFKAAVNANQTVGMLAQLDAGVRAMLIDTHYGKDRRTALCHGPCLWGELPHVDALRELAGFLADHPREVLTLIYEDGISVEDVVRDFDASGLLPYVYTKAPGEPWPTLGELIVADTRLLVTAQTAGPPPAWYHNLWTLAWDTAYSFETVESFDCAPNRGDPSHDLFLLNHWLSTELGIGLEELAVKANRQEVLLARAKRCQEESGALPNFVAVDFFEQGELFPVVDALNGF